MQSGRRNQEGRSTHQADVAADGQNAQEDREGHPTPGTLKEIKETGDNGELPIFDF